MSNPIATLGTVTINTAEPRRLAQFWMKILDVEISQEIPGDYFIWLRPQRRGGVAIAFQKVEEPQATPGRVHVDTTVEDIQVARRQIEELGGSLVAEHDMMGYRWSIMADPDGNRFCIVERPQKQAQPD